MLTFVCWYILNALKCKMLSELILTAILILTNKEAVLLATEAFITHFLAIFFSFLNAQSLGFPDHLYFCHILFFPIIDSSGLSSGFILAIFA